MSKKPLYIYILSSIAIIIGALGWYLTYTAAKPIALAPLISGLLLSILAMVISQSKKLKSFWCLLAIAVNTIGIIIALITLYNTPF